MGLGPLHERAVPFNRGDGHDALILSARNQGLLKSLHGCVTFRPMMTPNAPRQPWLAERRRFLAFAAGGLAVGFAAKPAAALCGVYPEADTLQFRARRGGREVGALRYAFFREAGGLLALTESELVLGPRRSFRQRVEETWQDGWLVALAADTWEDGSHYRLRAERRSGGSHDGAHGGGLAGQAGHLRFNVSGYVIPTTFWHRDTPYAQAVLSVVDGLTKVIQARPLPDEVMTLGGRPVPARGWQVAGEWSCLVWYDSDCTLMQVALPDARGDSVVLRREV